MKLALLYSLTLNDFSLAMHKRLYLKKKQRISNDKNVANDESLINIEPFIKLDRIEPLIDLQKFFSQNKINL